MRGTLERTVWKRRLALVLLLVLLPASDAAAVAAAHASGGERELIVWGAWRRRGLDAAFRRFEKEHPGWKVVTSTAAGAGQMDPQKLMCAIAGGSPPDTLIQDRLSVGEWALRNAFLSLDAMIRTSQRHEALAAAARDAISRNETQAARTSLEELIIGLRAIGPSRQLQLAEELIAGKLDEQGLSRAQELLALSQGIDPQRFYKACWEEACFGEGSSRRAYAIPNTTDVRLLYYNEDLLERAGLVDANGRARAPRDWDELRDYAVKLSERDASGKLQRVGFAPLLGQGFLYHYAWLNSGEFVAPDGHTCTLDAPANVAALAYMVDIYDRLGGVERVDAFKSTFQATDSELESFLVGKVAMKIDSDYFQHVIADYMPRMRFAVAPPPAPKGHESVTWSGGFSWVIPSGAKHPEMAFELIRFLMTDRVWELRNNVEERYAASRGTSFIPEMAPLPHVNEMTYDRFVRDNPDLPERFKRHVLLFAEMMKTSRYRPVTPVGQLLWDEQLRAAERATRHTLTPEQALRQGRIVVQKQLELLNENQARASSHNNSDGQPARRVTASVIAVGLLLLAGVTFFVARQGTSVLQAEARWGFIFASPWLIGLLVLTAGPIVASIVYSFTRYDVLHPPQFTGLENYRRLLTDDPLFWRSLGNTAFMMLGVPLGLAAGLGIAMLLNTEVRGMRVYRTIFYLPAIVPVVASSLLWLWVLNPEIGLVNSLLRVLGVSDPPGWLNSPSWLLGSKTAIILMGLWGAGSSMIIWLAGLKGIPRHLYEAAEIDGAGPWGRFRNVTLPMLSPYLFFNLIMGVIGTMQIFSQAYIMTKGGPDDSTLFYAFHLFNSAFRYFEMGYASAMAWILFVIVLALTLVQMWLGRRWVHYETT